MLPSTASRITTDHDAIRRWAELRGAKPMAVANARGAKSLALGFPGDEDNAALREIEWKAWLERFERNKLALLYQEQTPDGARSNFNQVVDREKAVEVKEAVGGRGRSASPRGAAKKKSRERPQMRTPRSTKARQSELQRTEDAQ